MSDKFLNSMHKIGGILNWKISNFRSVGSGLFSQEIELAPLTIICGENSSGKSTLLHSILLTQQILNDSWQSQVQDGEVIDLNGRYVQLGEFKSLVNLSKDPSNSSNNQISIGFQTLDLEPPAENETPFRSINLQFSNKYDDEKVKADSINMEYLTIPNFQDKFVKFPNERKRDIDITHASLNFERKNEESVHVKRNENFFNGSKNNWNCNYSVNHYEFKEISPDFKPDQDWFKFNDYLVEGEVRTIIDFDKIIEQGVLPAGDTLNAVRFNGGFPQEVAHEYDLNVYFASYFTEIFSGYLNEYTFKNVHAKLNIIDDDDITDSSDSELDSFTPDYQEIDTTPDFPYDDAELDEINYDFPVDEVEVSSDDDLEYITENEFIEYMLEELSELFELMPSEGDLFFGFEYRFGEFLKSNYSNKDFNDIRGLDIAERNDFVEDIYNDLASFAGGFDNINKESDEDVIVSIESTIRSIMMNSIVPVSHFEALVKDKEFLENLEKKVRRSLESIQRIDKKYISSSFKKVPPSYVTDINIDVGSFEFRTPVEFIDSQLEEFRDALNGVKYLGPLRSLSNFEKREFNFSPQTPIGISGELFFNYFELNKNKLIEFYTPEGIPSVEPLKDAFSLWLSFFDIADSFDTNRDDKESTVSGRIRPKMLDEEVRMDSLGVGFSQLAPIILLCLTSKTGDTILLEQPELHLHPSVQQKFGDFLLTMSKDKQIIVETHSDHLLNRVRRRVSESDTNIEESVGIYFAQREKGLTEFRLAELDNNGRYKLTDFPKGFFDQGAEDAFIILKNSLLQGEQENIEPPDEAPY